MSKNKSLPVGSDCGGKWKREHKINLLIYYKDWTHTSMMYPSREK